MTNGKDFQSTLKLLQTHSELILTMLYCSAWYKELVESNQIMDESKDEEQSKEDDQEHQKPYVPWRKDLMDVSTFRILTKYLFN